MRSLADMRCLSRGPRRPPGRAVRQPTPKAQQPRRSARRCPHPEQVHWSQPNRPGPDRSRTSQVVRARIRWNGVFPRLPTTGRAKHPKGPRSKSTGEASTIASNGAGYSGSRHVSAMAPGTSKRSKSLLGSYPPRDELVNSTPIKARCNQRTWGCSPCPVQVPKMLEKPPWSLGANPLNPRDHQSCPSFRLVHYRRRQHVPQKPVHQFSECVYLSTTLSSRWTMGNPCFQHL